MVLPKKILISMFVLLSVATPWPGVCGSKKVSKMTTRCVGRFNFVLPEEFEEIGRSQSQYSVTMKAITLRETDAASLWSERVRQVRAENNLTQRQALRTATLENGDPAIFYQKPSSPLFTFLESQRTFDGHVVRFGFTGKAGMEKEMSLLVQRRGDRYHPGADTGFCIGPGSITGKVGLNENAHVLYKSRKSGISVSVNTQQVGKVLSPHPLHDIAQEQMLLQQEGVNLEVITNTQRKAANQSGHEGRLRLSSKREGDHIKYTWFFEGVDGDATRPEIRIVATGDASNIERFDPVWNAVLETLRSRPVQ